MSKVWTTAALALALALSTPALATTRYVDGSCATNGNGSSKTCGASGPWKNVINVSCSGFQPGDIIEVRGGTYAVDNWNVPTGCAGTASNPVIIQNAANEAVVWEGTTDIRGSTWTSQGNGVYLCSSGTCGTNGKFPFTAWYKRGSNNEERLDLVQSNRTCDSSVPAGKMRYTASSQVCVHLSDGSSPASAAYFRIPTYAVAVNLNAPGTDNVMFRKNPAGGSFTIQRYRDHGIQMTALANTGITIDGLDIGWVMDRCINDSGGGVAASVHVVKNCKVHHCGQEGIDLRDTTATGSLIENNEIYEIQRPPLFEKCYQVGSGCLQGMSDNGVAMMVGETSNAIIRGNVVHDYGGGTYDRGYALSLENGAINALVENNVFYNSMLWSSGDPNLAAGTGVMLESLLASDNYNGTIIRNNRVMNVDICFAMNAAQSLTNTQTLRWQNNTCVDPTRYGFFDEKGTWGSTTNVTLQNMLFANINRPLSQTFIYVPTNDTGVSKATTSLFWCPSCSASQNVIFWKGSNYQNTASSVTSYQAGNVVGNPNLATTGAPPTLQIVSASGAAYNAGAAMTGFTLDALGTTRPQMGAWDIGAMEFASGQLAAPVLLEAVQVP